MENSMEGVFHNQPAQAPNDTVQFTLPSAPPLAEDNPILPQFLSQLLYFNEKCL